MKIAFALEDITIQYLSLAPNAGGQNSYALRLGLDQDKRELGFFANQYLNAGGLPLIGVIYSIRFPLCQHSCLVRSVFQLGGGFSSAGPMVEFLWSTIPLWFFRIDIATHVYATTTLPILWNYPLWLGLTLPF